MQNILDIDLVIFSVDGTLARPWESELLPGRREATEKLFKEGKRMMMVTNQSGPAFREWHLLHGGGRERNYPSLNTIVSEMDSIRRQVNAERCYIALHPGNEEIAKSLFNRMQIDPDDVIELADGKVRASYRLGWSKPMGKMIETAIKDADADRRRCIYVGNAPRDLDAARAAEVRYVDADDFFYGWMTELVHP